MPRNARIAATTITLPTRQMMEFIDYPLLGPLLGLCAVNARWIGPLRRTAK